MSETTARDIFTNPETYENISRPVPEPEEGKSYALRNLEARDVFLMSKILGSIGIKEFRQCFNSEDVKKLSSAENTEDVIENIGITVMFDIAGIILDNLPACENHVYKFLASLSGMKENWIESMPMNTFVEMIIDVIQKEEFKDFMKVVSRSFK